MFTNKCAVIMFVVFSCILEIAQAIRCLECNSMNNTMCLDPTIYDRDTIQKFIGSVDCNVGVISPGRKDFFCRKIVQTILYKGREPEVRVTRGCGWVKHHRDCYKADNEDHLETVCQCFTSDCNGAINLRSFSLVGTILTTISVLGLSFCNS